MTGITWLDAPAAAAFVVVALVSLARSLAGVLPAHAFVVVVDGATVVPAGGPARPASARAGDGGGAGEPGRRAEAAAHAVMAAGMAAMSWPGGPTLDGGGAVAWAAACAVTGVGAVAMLARRRPTGRAGARAAHLLLAAVVMVVALGAGHGSGAHGAGAHGSGAHGSGAHGAGPHGSGAHGDAGQSVGAPGGSHGPVEHGADPGAGPHGTGHGSAGRGAGTDVATADHGHASPGHRSAVGRPPVHDDGPATAAATEGDLGALGDAGRRAAAWPVWPLAGVAFAAEGLGRGRVLARRVRSVEAPDRSTGGDRWWGRCLTGDRPDHVCGIVMAAGMATMAFGL
jgi:hypothetical protein